MEVSKTMDNICKDNKIFTHTLGNRITEVNLATVIDSMRKKKDELRHIGVIHDVRRTTDNRTFVIIYSEVKAPNNDNEIKCKRVEIAQKIMEVYQ